jgi:hypothetical protein
LPTTFEPVREFESRYVAVPSLVGKISPPQAAQTPQKDPRCHLRSISDENDLCTNR